MDKLTIHLSQVSEGMSLLDEDEIKAVVDMLREVKKQGGTVYVFGNGGSAATSSHFVNDLVKMYGLKAVSLPDMTPVVTAYGNDDGWENMFSGALHKFLKENDGVIGISCSGNSRNVVTALRFAVMKTQYTACLTGMSLSSDVHTVGVEHLVHAMVPDIRVQEDLHTVICHAMVRMVMEER